MRGAKNFTLFFFFGLFKEGYKPLVFLLLLWVCFSASFYFLFFFLFPQVVLKANRLLYLPVLWGCWSKSTLRAVWHPLGLSMFSQGLSPPFTMADDAQAWDKVPVRTILLVLRVARGCC